jgi:spore coat polysaccharide biosynthesis protein SpsF
MKTKKNIAIIQARMESTRLPGKSTIPLAGKPLIAHVIERTKLIQGISNTILATSATKANDVLKELADEYKIDFFQGSETNVLDRYYNSANNYDCNYVMRITGDNPFMDIQYASDTLQKAIEEDADICSPQDLPLGVGVEIISMTSLKVAHKEANLPYQLEHVSPYIKENTDKFKIVKFSTGFECEFENLRLTIDTEEDLKFAQIISQNLYKGTPYPLIDIINFLKLNPQLLLINSQVKQRPMTHSAENDVK